MTGKTLGHYLIESKLGEGSMGVVYRARDLHLDRPVAIKVLPSEAMANPDRKLRFIQEARAASALNHPNIVHVYDIDTVDGQDFIAMEFVVGRNLDQIAGGKVLPLADVLKYAVQIADALGKAHQAGVVHRDLKLANIMVTEDGRVKVLDFGVAKLLGIREPNDLAATLSIQNAPPQTEIGVIVGTIGYMSPEQAESKPVDARSDIFSLGSVIYELTTGRPAFTGETMISTIAAILREEPKPAGDVAAGVPPELERIIARCLRKDPDRRFQRMEDVKAALEELREELSARRRRPFRAYLAAGVLAGAAAAVLAIRLFWHPAPEAAPPAVSVVPLTTFAGTEREPSFSPDGSQVAFSWDGESGNNFDIYVKLIGGGALLRLTSDSAHEGFPAWSPDGRQIAFLRQLGERPGVFLISPLGGPERKLSDAANGKIAWSPDGKFLIVCDYDLSGENVPPPAGPAPGVRREGPVSVYVVSAANGERRKLFSAPAEAAFDTDFAFSPDGRNVAFTRWGRTGADVYVLPMTSGAAGPAAAGNPRRLTTDNRYIRGLAWTNNSARIVFSSNRTGPWTLWRVDAKGVSAAGPEQVAGVTGDAFHPAISHPGQNGPVRLAYEHAVQDVNIWRMDLTSSRVGRAVKLVASTRFDGNPQISPDGKRLVFTSDRSGFFEIWLAGADGTNPAQLTALSAPMTASPRWSPDGQRVAFDSQSGNNRDIYVTSADGGGSPRRITSEPSEEARPCWAKDGQWVYFMSTRSGLRQVWKAPAEGGAAVQVTRGGGYECQESADGKFLYYTKGVDELWSVPVGGGAEVLVIESVKMGSWVAGKRGIYFVDFTALRPGAPKPVKLYKFSTRQITQLAALEGQADSGRRMLAIDPDDRWLLWSQTDAADSDLMLAENFQ